jgi:hypothetical protein
MENQIIKIENLLVGDEVIYGCGSDLRRIRIVRPLVVAKNRSWGGHYSSTKVEILNVNDLNDTTPIRTIYLDLNHRCLWLIKRTAI